MAKKNSKYQFFVVTGNPNKAKNALNTMTKVFNNVRHYHLDLPEIQSLDLEEIVRHKLQFALENFRAEITDAEELKKSILIVEDISLEFKAMGKLPGTFVKFFVKELGLEKMCRLPNGFKECDRDAKVKCVVGVVKANEATIDKANFFTSEVTGSISDKPLGKGGFGFDAVFIPDGFNNKTAGELDDNEYAEYFALIRKYDVLAKII